MKPTTTIASDCVRAYRAVGSLTTTPSKEPDDDFRPQGENLRVQALLVRVSESGSDGASDSYLGASSWTGRKCASSERASWLPSKRSLEALPTC